MNYIKIVFFLVLVSSIMGCSLWTKSKQIMLTGRIVDNIQHKPLGNFSFEIYKIDKPRTISEFFFTRNILAASVTTDSNGYFKVLFDGNSIFRLSVEDSEGNWRGYCRTIEMEGKYAEGNYMEGNYFDVRPYLDYKEHPLVVIHCPLPK